VSVGRFEPRLAWVVIQMSVRTREHCIRGRTDGPINIHVHKRGRRWDWRLTAEAPLFASYSKCNSEMIIITRLEL